MLKILFNGLMMLMSAGLLMASAPDHKNTASPNENTRSNFHTLSAGLEVNTDADRFFVSSNTRPVIGVFTVMDDNSIGMEEFNSVAADADGIHYDREADVLYQLNRTDNVINAYSDVCTDPMLSATSTSGFRNGREIAVWGNKLVAVQDAGNNNGQRNKLVVYNLFSSNAISFDKAFAVDINLWGIHASGQTLYAVIDNSNQIAVFENFFSQSSGFLSPDATIAIEGLVRTHGITYDADSDMMLLTDIGSAGSATDGAFIVIRNFTAAGADGMVSMDEQIRVGGAASMLGNPVDIALDKDRDRVYIAERANGGGRVLGFLMPAASGSIAPVYNQTFAGASAIYFSDGDDMPNNAPLDQLFLSSNTQPVIGVYDILANDAIASSTISSMAADADGIYYDKAADVLYQLNRSSSVINAYSNVSTSPMLTATSTSDFTNGREIAVMGNKLVATQDADASNGMQNRLLVYSISPTSITLDKAFDVDINLWGVHADGGTLYAVVDNSSDVAIYHNFFSQPAGMLSPDAVVTIEGLVRTHGITYDAEDDIMLLTDVGDAASATDGALIVVHDFMAAAADGTVSMDEQIRVEGMESMLGNPVDLAFDKERSMIHVAERANGGGRLLSFMLPMTSGSIAPVYNELFAGASAIYFSDGDAMPDDAPMHQLFLSSNTQPVIGVYDIWAYGALSSSTISSMAADADGIYYDKAADVLYQLNRSSSVINAYSNVSTSPMLTATSTSDFTNGREIAVMGNKLVATQDADASNGMQNRLLVYSISPTSITLDKAFDVGINLWGVHADGGTLYAVVDNSSDVAIYHNFFSQPAGMLSPDAVVTIEGLVRTHGITYDAEDDMMLLTDVGDAASATDGALIVVHDFMAAAADGMVSMDEQIRVEGMESMLGNPVDLAFDKERSRIYVAERANGGGRLLSFMLPMTSGSIAPVYNTLFTGASAIYFTGSDGDMQDELAGPTPVAAALQTIQSTLGDLRVTNLFPSPATDQLNLRLNSPADQEVTIGIFNAAGNLVTQQRMDLNAGENQTVFDISGWPAGMYFLRIPGLDVTSRFVKAAGQ